MERKELLKHTDSIMRCKNCGEEYKYFEVVAEMDSAGLPGELIWINGCKKCGGIHYDEIRPGDICD